MNTKTATIPKFISSVVTSKLFGIISFTLLTVVAAQITIPVQPVPFTLQTVMVVLAGAFLGAKNGAYSQLLYLLLGCLGLPVFAHIPAAFGFMRLFGPTGGYLLSFPIAAYVTGYFLENNKSYLTTTLTMFLANIIIIAMGTLFLYTFYVKNLTEAITYGAAVFSIWTVVKVFLSINIFYAIKKPGKSA
jgi:biotin transport system substrate-specific component